MYIIPAIDLIEGKCVRLIQGQYHRQITYQDDPVKQAREFSLAGAEWLHIVDLDGARVGRPVNTDTISAIAALGQLKIEIGGGLRDEAAIKQLLDMGVERVIIGTKAVSDFEWFARCAEKLYSALMHEAQRSPVTAGQKTAPKTCWTSQPKRRNYPWRQ